MCAESQGARCAALCLQLCSGTQAQETSGRGAHIYCGSEKTIQSMYT